MKKDNLGISPLPTLQTINEEEAKVDQDSIERKQSEGSSGSTLVHNPQSNPSSIATD